MPYAAWMSRTERLAQSPKVESYMTGKRGQTNEQINGVIPNDILLCS